MEQKFIDRDGLKVLWNQVNLKDYPNNETLMAVIDAIDETKANKDELFSKSWNDLEDKPFGEETAYTEVFAEQEVEFSSGRASLGNIWTDEKIYMVTIDGVSQTGQAYYQGNPVYSWCFSFDGGWGVDVDGFYANDIADGTHTVKVQQVETAIALIDEKYLPEMVGKKIDGGGEIFNNIDENNASGEYSHAEGAATNSEGYASHAEGQGCKSLGRASHTEGRFVEASGNSAHAEGYYTLATSKYQHVQGKYNIEDTENQYAHIVGNGSNSGSRTNAHTLDWEGNAWFSGDVYVSSTSGINKDEGSKKLVTEDYVTTKLSDYYLKSEADALHTEIEQYVDSEIADLVGAAPETLNTIEELATAFEENAEVVEVLNTAITNKADKIHVHSWNEIENKPFYKEVIQNIRLSYIATKTSETTLAMNVLWSDLYNLYNWDGKISYADKILDVSVTFSDSNGYSYLEIDGVSTSFPPDSIKEIILTGEEFVENSYQVNFCEETENIKTIDVEFLPDMVGEKSDAIGCEIFNTYEGYDKNTASGHYSHAEGSGTTANGVGAHAEGYYAVASNDYAHAEGYKTTASSYASHAEGDYTTASGENSHAEGNGTTASGNNSHAEGNNTVSSGENSHAEGSNTTASGNESHAEGAHTVSSGEYSHAEGYLTIATSKYQHVQGKCNIEDIENEYAHIVGNGDTDYIRSNAHTIDWKGNAWFSGDVYTGSTSGTNKDEGSKKLATEDYVTTELSDYYLKSEVDTIHTEIEDYVDTEVAALVNAAPETLDTLGELAQAFEENKEVVEALDASITNKQDKVSDTLILVDTITGIQHKIQIQNGQLISFSIE